MIENSHQSSLYQIVLCEKTVSYTKNIHVWARILLQIAIIISWDSDDGCGLSSQSEQRAPRRHTLQTNINGIFLSLLKKLMLPYTAVIMVY